MPRRARLTLAGVPLHLVQRGNNRQLCFYRDLDRRLYLEWLAEYADAAGCAIHAYVLMTNHVHLLLTPESARSASAMMKALGQRYVQHINRTQQRSGSLWEGRFRSCMIQDRRHLIACHRYIELNPVRAGMATHPGDYPWSSYRSNALGEASNFLQQHPLYLALGSDAAARRAAYSALFGQEYASGFVEFIRRATNGNWVLGDREFVSEIEEQLLRRCMPGIRGRPRKE